MKLKLDQPALSIRQPWAWLLAHGHKDIENRSWPTKFRGRIYLHASQGMTPAEYSEARDLAELLGIQVPPRMELERGGIIGEADLVDCVSNSSSPWFFGPRGFVITNARPLTLIPCRGELGLFRPTVQYRPSLEISHEDFCAWVATLAGGERVIEAGESGMQGQTGTVVICDGKRCISWDTVFDRPGTMVTSFTGGARAIR